MKVIPGEWEAELENQWQFFEQFESTLPSEIKQEYLALKGRLGLGKSPA